MYLEICAILGIQSMTEWRDGDGRERQRERERERERERRIGLAHLQTFNMVL